MITKYLLTFLMSAICWISYAQPADTLKRMMEEHLKAKGKKPVHSIQLLMAKGDSLFNEAVGFSDGKTEKARRDNQFKIASITKTMTAVVILQLQEEGSLTIDDPISKYLTDVASVRLNELHYFKKKPYGGLITIRQLLQHTSGLADLFTDGALRFYSSEYLHKKQEWNSTKLMNRYYKYKLNRKAHFKPGDGYYYSDVNYFLLGLIIEKLTGQSLAQQFRSRIFEPLKMDNSYFEYYEPLHGNGKMATTYFGKLNITKKLNTSYDWAGGGVVSTTADLATFIKSLFEKRLYANDSTLTLMTKMVPHTLKSGRVSYYGLGLFKYTLNGDTYYGHGGFWGCGISYCPTKNITVGVSFNQVTPGFNTTKFIDELLATFERGK